MKKIVSLLLCVIMIAAVFAGCGASGGELTDENLAGKWSLDLTGIDMDALQELMSSSLGQSTGVGENASKLIDALGSDFIAELLNEEAKCFVLIFEKDRTMKCEIDLNDFKESMVDMISKMYGKIGEMDIAKAADILGQDEASLKSAMEAAGASSLKDYFDSQTKMLETMMNLYLNEETLAKTFGDDATISDGKAIIGDNTYKVEGNKIIMTNAKGNESSMTVNYAGSYIEILDVEGAGDEDGQQAAMIVKGAKLIRE